MKLTVFTPTYNREYCLSDLYVSLCKQTCRDFTWLVIDDGSSDNTEELIAGFKSENKISIKYIKQINAGKHVAMNRAFDECKTELIICVDSDDSLTEDAVAIILNKYYNESRQILGLYFRRVHKDGSRGASEYPKDLKYVGITDLYHDYDFHGDTAIVLRTDLIDKFRFPVFAEERFVTERVFYNLINTIAPMLLCEDEIYISDYLSDGYTKNAVKLAINNPYGSAMAFLSESIYGNKIIYRSKNYAEYLAFIDLFHLDETRLNKYTKPNRLIHILGHLCSPHYKQLYGIQRKQVQEGIE